MNFIPLNGWPQLKEIPEQLEHFREVYARFAKVNRWYQSIEETELTGNPVIFEKALKLNATALSVDMLPIQSGTGDPSPENVRPISGRTSVNVGRTGKNLLAISATTETVNGVTFTINSDGTINANGTATALISFNIRGTISFANGSYILNGCPTGGSASTYRIDFFANEGDTGNGYAFSVSNGTLPNIRIRIEAGYTCNNLVFKPMIRLASVSDPTFAPYTPVTLTIALGTTVYGGTLGVKTGVLTITWAIHNVTWGDGTGATILGSNTRKRLPDLPDVPKNIQTATISNIAPYLQNWESDTTHFYIQENKQAYAFLPNDTSADTQIQICYELATPTTVQLTGAELEMLKGYNYISTDADSLTVKAYTI